MDHLDPGNSPYLSAMESVEAMKPMLETLEAVKNDIIRRGFSQDSAEACAISWWAMIMRVAEPLAELNDENADD